MQKHIKTKNQPTIKTKTPKLKVRVFELHHSSSMAEAICRVLRDGALEGELAPALTIKDFILSPLSSHVFDHVLSQLYSFILAGKSQSRFNLFLLFLAS